MPSSASPKRNGASSSKSRAAEKDYSHRTRLQKLGAKPEWRVSIVSVGDPDFIKELRGAVEQVSVGRVIDDCDAIFFGAVDAKELARVGSLKKSIKQNGAVWVIRPKGRPEISERAVMDAGKAAGLVDVKVISFSPTHTGLKFVIPVANRR
ncbi:MAG TPA: hypothetical protein VFA59_00385 [Vicinamibacterales bacterium]|nr:hypothetical protein [Vicinamibacterales bacterium]